MNILKHISMSLLVLVCCSTMSNIEMRQAKYKPPAKREAFSKLMNAIQMDETKKATNLFKSQKEMLDEEDKRALLDVAIEKGNQNIVNMLRAADARTSLELAVQENSLNNFRILLDKALKQETIKGLLFGQDKQGKTVLHHIIENDQLDFMDVLLKIAQQAKNKRLIDDVAYLFMIGDKKEGKTPMHHAVKQNKIKMLQLLFNTLKDEKKSLAYILSLKDKNGRTPLYLAVADNNTKLVTFLVQHVFDALKDDNRLLTFVMNPQDTYGRTPLHLAVAQNNSKMVSFLIEHGAKVNIRDRNGYTALKIAIDKDFKNIIPLLWKHMPAK